MSAQARPMTGPTAGLLALDLGLAAVLAVLWLAPGAPAQWRTWQAPQPQPPTLDDIDAAQLTPNPAAGAAYPGVLQRPLMDPARRPQAAASAPAAAAAAPAPALGPPGAPGSLAVIGVELPPEQAWPAPGLPPTPTGSAARLRVSGSAGERQQAVAQLAATRPESLLLVVHAPSSPDRGTARFVREAARHAGRVALWPVAAAAPSAAGEGAGAGGENAADTPAIARWQRWLQSEGFSALALVPSAPAATNWIAQSASQPQPQPQAHAASPAPTP